MSLLAQKLATARRVARSEGWAGMSAAVNSRLNLRRFLQPPLDYARLAPSAIALLALHGRPDVFINAIGAGIGDDLLCTAMLRELRARRVTNVWLTTRYPALFGHSPDLRVVVPPLGRYDRLVQQLGTRIVYPWYTSYHPGYDRDDPMPEQHIIAVMCQKAGITGPIALRPYLTLTQGELQAGRLVMRQVAIQSSGLVAKHSMLNKNWPLERYREVVAALQGEFNFVQVGSRDDPPLPGAVDLRGKTSLRETAAVLAGSLAFVGQVGLLMHLARAVDCRSVIVYGGRETPEQSGYVSNENIYTALPCSPCWRLNACPIERACLTSIGVDAVIAGLRRQVERFGTPLEVAQHTITAEQIERNALRHKEAAAVHEYAWSMLYQ